MFITTVESKQGQRCFRFISIAKKNTPTRSNFREKSGCLASKSQVTVHLWGGVKAGAQADSHMASMTRAKRMSASSLAAPSFSLRTSVPTGDGAPNNGLGLLTSSPPQT